MNMLPNMPLIADSLGWAVLHSLWQGLVAAGIVYTVRNLTRERASEARYFTGIITLCALLCAFIGTFLYYYNTGAVISSAVNANVAQTITIGSSEAVNTGNPLMRLGDFTGLIGMFWTVCFAVLGMRYLAAFRLTNKLRNHGLSDLTEECQARFRALVDASGVTPKVRAYFSEHVSSPITFGFFKPIILVPTWFFTGMTPDQCEAVLLHELAHIRRHDYLTNILQIAIKTVFFYHPAVQFICKGLDVDREHACDDFAVMLTKNPEGLATALGTIRLKAARDGGVFALSADGRDAPLMHRLKRLMGTQSINMEKGTSRGLAATAMIGSTLALMMTLGATTSQAHPHKPDVTEAPEAVEAPEWVKTPKGDKLAGAATTNLVAWGSKVGKTVTVKGNTYTATSFDFSADGKGTDTINGKKYPSKYAYSVYAKDGKSYVVKRKNGKRYMEIDDNWYRVDEDRFARSFAVPTPPVTPTPSVRVTASVSAPIVGTRGTNYWVNDKVLAATEARIERANDRREATLERVEEALTRAMEQSQEELERAEEQLEAAFELEGENREAAMERAEELREDALERAEDARDRAEEIREEALERAEEIREEALERAEEIREEALERAEEQREAAMERSSGQREQYYDMRDRLIPLLKADGFMKNAHSKVTIKMTSTDIFINGKKLTDAQEGKYCDIVSDYISRKGDVKKIVIKPGYLHVSQKGDGHNSSFTHNDN